MLVLETGLLPWLYRIPTTTIWIKFLEHPNNPKYTLQQKTWNLKITPLNLPNLRFEFHASLYSKQPQDPLGLLDRRQRDAENFDGEVFAFLELSCCRFFVGWNNPGP